MDYLFPPSPYGNSDNQNDGGENPEDLNAFLERFVTLLNQKCLRLWPVHEDEQSEDGELDEAEDIVMLKVIVWIQHDLVVEIGVSSSDDSDPKDDVERSHNKWEGSWDVDVLEKVRHQLRSKKRINIISASPLNRDNFITPSVGHPPLFEPFHH